MFLREFIPHFASSLQDCILYTRMLYIKLLHFQKRVNRIKRYWNLWIKSCRIGGYWRGEPQRIWEGFWMFVSLFNFYYYSTIPSTNFPTVNCINPTNVDSLSCHKLHFSISSNSSTPYQHFDYHWRLRRCQISVKLLRFVSGEGQGN